jgi:type VI protein secretion system component Hcp
VQNADAASVDYYLKIEGVKGESNISNYSDYMKISNWNWGLVNSNGTDIISQLNAQKQGIPKEFNFTMVTNSASPTLLQATLTGQHFMGGELVGLEQTSNGVQDLFTITFSDILISGYQTSESPTDDFPTDQITFNFANANLTTQTNGNPSRSVYTGIPNIVTANPEYKIPSWIKNNAGWWSNGQIGESDFVKGMQYLIQQGIMKVPQGQSQANQSNQIPTWVKNNAQWWSEGAIGDSDFVKGIQWLISNGIIKI